MFIVTEKRELLHLLHGCEESFSKGFLGELKKEYKTWCPFANHGKKVDKNCFHIHQLEEEWGDYLRYFAFVVSKFHDTEKNRKEFSDLCQNLTNADLINTREDFESRLTNLIPRTKKIEEELVIKLKNFTCEECQRLGEAFACLYADCFTASAVMSASAVESRLQHLLKKKDSKLFKTPFDRGGLGKLISLFSGGKDFSSEKFKKFKKMIPEKHMPLLDLINTYRILSAHPKKEYIDYRVSESLIDLAIVFLTDPKLK